MQNTAQNTDFSFLDQDDFRAKYASGPELNRMRFYVGGIRCGKCVRKLEDLTIQLPGLRRLQIEMGKNLAHVEVDGAVLPFARVAERISNLGFEPIPLPQDSGLDEIEQKESRRDLVRLAVAGACAANIMTFSFAIYFGVGGELAKAFSFLSFLLYLPVVSYVALPFYRGAWQSLKQRQISIDLPMAIASLSGFIFSCVQLWRGHPDIYFDSLSGFLFLILASRWTQKRMQKRFLRAQELSESFNLQRVRKVESGGWAWRPIEMLKTGDCFLLNANETLPADAELQTTRAYFSMAWLSGEARAKTFLRGSTVPAGARLTSGEALLIARRPLSETSFGQILEEVQRFSLSQNKTVQTADRWAQWLLAGVFSTALVFLISYWHISPEAAVQRSLALIILACPCAMAFGTPLALAASLRKARRSGLIVRDANVFERMRHLKIIFFDKTGTLTDAELSLKEDPNQIPTVYQKIILALENDSLHPIAFAFRKALPRPETLPPCERWRETPGQGVSGFVYGRQYELRSDRSEQGSTSCSLLEDGKSVYKFTFGAQIKQDTHDTLMSLRRSGYSLRLLSGDNPGAVEQLARDLGFLRQEVFSQLTPQDKAQLVASSPESMMVGDGVNDSLALMKADVSLAVSGGVEAALKSSQVYLTEPGLQGVSKLFEISHEAFQLIRQNLLLSVIYNSIGGILALLGYVNPFVAALLMPASSGLILFNTWRRAQSR